MMDAQRLSCGVLTAWILLINLGQAQTTNLSQHTLVTQAMVGQASTNGDRRESDDLLRRARGAIKDGNLAQARWYLERAEKMQVDYSGLLKRFVDTPQKVRRDLAKLD